MPSPLFSRSMIAFAVVTLATGTAVAALSLRSPHRQVKFQLDSWDHPRIAPNELADWIIQGKRDFTVIDLRATEAYDKDHVKDAVHCGSCHDSRQQGRQSAQEHFIDLSKKLVVYSETGKESVELPKILAKNPRLLVLDGGWAKWQRDILEPVTFGSEDSLLGPEQLEAKQRKAAVRGYFTGERPGASAQPASLPVTPIRRENAHQPAAAHEGC